MISGKGSIGNGYNLFVGVGVMEAGEESACSSVSNDNLVWIKDFADILIESKLIFMCWYILSSDSFNHYVVPNW